MDVDDRWGDPEPQAEGPVGVAPPRVSGGHARPSKNKRGRLDELGGEPPAPLDFEQGVDDRS